jgi:uncharacterized SAM-binding protein YcdF (DUF218 family)
MNFIIVLGSSNTETRRLRVQKAVDYYHHLVAIDHVSYTVKRGINSFTTYDDEYASCVKDRIRIVFSGKGNREVSEGADMCRLAIDLGIPENLCIVEPESQNTYENLVNTLNVLQSYSWFKPTFYSTKPVFTICTSHFHAKRSLVMAVHILSNYGHVNIIHTGEPISNESAQREKEILDVFVREYMLPKMTVNY